MIYFSAFFRQTVHVFPAFQWKIHIKFSLNLTKITIWPIKLFFYGWDSIVSRLHSHYDETVYFLPLRSQELSSWYSFDRPQKDERLSRHWSPLPRPLSKKELCAFKFTLADPNNWLDSIMAESNLCTGRCNSERWKIVCLSLRSKTNKLEIEIRHTSAETRYRKNYLYIQKTALPIQTDFLWS